MPKVIEGNMLEFTADESRQGHCPVCRQEGLNYGASVNEAGMAGRLWKCPRCSANGTELGRDAFGGYRLDRDSIAPNTEKILLQRKGW